MCRKLEKVEEMDLLHSAYFSLLLRIRSSMRKYDSLNADRKQSSFLAMLHWCFQNVECQRSVILKYFDETVTNNCRVRDICQGNNTVVESDITDVAKKAILCVQISSTTPEKKNFTLNYFAKIITGKKVKHEHDKYPEYGILAGSTEYGEYLTENLITENLTESIQRGACGTTSISNIKKPKCCLPYSWS